MNIFEKFKVVAVSNNTNSFGLHQCVMIAKDGTAYKACANSINVPKRDEVIDVRVILNKKGEVLDYDFTSRSFEIPERIEDAPNEVIEEIWK